MKKFILFSSILTMTILLSFSVDSAFAHPHHGNILINNHTHEPLTEIIPINSMIGLEKSTVFFHAPSGNTLPWGFVEGKVAKIKDELSLLAQPLIKDSEKTVQQLLTEITARLGEKIEIGEFTRYEL